MKGKLLIGLLILATSASAFSALSSNVSKVCIYNGTDNKGSHIGNNHFLQAQLSWPGVAVPAANWGPNADYKQWSCVSTSVLKDGSTTDVFSVGHAIWHDAFTNCNYSVYHNVKTEQKNITAYYKATQISSLNGDTQCKFLKNGYNNVFPAQ